MSRQQIAIGAGDRSIVMRSMRLMLLMRTGGWRSHRAYRRDRFPDSGRDNELTDDGHQHDQPYGDHARQGNQSTEGVRIHPGFAKISKGSLAVLPAARRDVPSHGQAPIFEGASFRACAVFRPRPARLLHYFQAGAKETRCGHRAGAAGERHVDGQVVRGFGVRVRRPSCFQPSRRGVRRRRDVLGRVL